MAFTMILDEIAASTRLRVQAAKNRCSPACMKGSALSLPVYTDFPFENALRAKGMSFICEVKKASPSKGVIAEEFPYLQIAAEYEQAGASAISVLTEPVFFQGRSEYLSEIRGKVKITLLRKDFIIDEYQIYEAKKIGADAVLLICALLDTQTVREYIKLCDRLGLSALVEAHTAKEVQAAVEAGARIIGVNNRNLKTFEVDLQTCIRLRPLIPAGILFVAESGIQSPEDIRNLREAGIDGVLIGETLMRSKNKTVMLKTLKGE